MPTNLLLGSLLIANSAILSLSLTSKWLENTHDSAPEPLHRDPLFHYIPNIWLEMWTTAFSMEV